MDQAVIVALVVVAFLYFMPWVIAGIRGHHNTMAIFILNLFLGWTFLGWIAALIWSFTNVPKATTIYRDKIVERQTPHL
jgi:hypothetical protein